MLPGYEPTGYEALGCFGLLKVPDRLVFEADEYMFTLLPALGEVAILPDALTFYRIHGNNLYQGSRNLPIQYKIDEKLIKRALIYECLSNELPGASKKGVRWSASELAVGTRCGAGLTPEAHDRGRDAARQLQVGASCRGAG